MLLCQDLNRDSSRIVFLPATLLLFILIQSIDNILCVFGQFGCRLPDIDLPWLAVLLFPSLLDHFVLLHGFKHALLHVI